MNDVAGGKAAAVTQAVTVFEAEVAVPCLRLSEQQDNHLPEPARP